MMSVVFVAFNSMEHALRANIRVTDVLYVSHLAASRTNRIFDHGDKIVG